MSILGKRRTREGDMGENRNVLSRTDIQTTAHSEIEIRPVPTSSDVVDQLRQIGENIDAAANSSQQTNQEAFDNIQSEFTNTFSASTTQVAQALITNGPEDEIKRQFVNSLKSVTDRMIDELSIADQAKMFKLIIDIINAKLTDNQLVQELEREPNQQGRVKELISKMGSVLFNYAMIQMTATISNIYKATPRVIRQITSAITATCMIYNYAPSQIRNALEILPVMGPMFTVMNSVNPEMVIAQNSAAAVTTIYYLLRNAGVDVTPAINSLGEMTKGAAIMCARPAKEYVCKKVDEGLSKMQQGASDVLNSIGDKFTNTLMDYYNASNAFDDNFSRVSSISSATPPRVLTPPRPTQRKITLPRTPMRSSSSSASSSSSMPSLFSSLSSVKSNLPSEVASLSSATLKIDTSSLSDSEKTRRSIQSVESLFSISIDDGGINISAYNYPPEILSERFDAIVQGNISNPIIAQPIQTASEVIPVANAEAMYSQSSDISDLTENSNDDNILAWLFGNNSSGGAKVRRKISRTSRRRILRTKKYRQNKRKKTSKRKHRRTRKR